MDENLTNAFMKFADDAKLFGIIGCNRELH